MRLASLLLFLAACGSGGVSGDQACADEAAARCSQFSACSVMDVALQRAFPDMNTCLQREKLSCTAALSAPMSGNTPSLIEKCTAAIKAMSCGDFLDGATPQDCIVPGPLANGAPCYANAQCQSSVCLLAKGSACGTCQPQPAAGASCATTGCGHNLNCPTAAMMCEVLGTQGAACDRLTPCASGFSCIGANAAMMKQGACQAAASSVDAPCDPKQQVMPGCDTTKGLTCNNTLNCAVTVLAPNQGSCGKQTDGSNVQCAAGGGCYPLGAATGTCATAAADGAACDTMNGPPCLLPARCVTAAGSTAGTCQLVDPASCK
jgi:hypothetical protein